GLEHALLALGCLYVGIPHCPVSPAYSTVSQDYEKLRHVLTTLTPGLVFASDASRYGKAVAAAVPKDVEVVYTVPSVRTEPVEVPASPSTGPGRTGVTAFSEL